MFNIINQVSPGIVITEHEVVLNPPARGTLTNAAFVGEFSWGPVEEVVYISNANQLYNLFRNPNDTDTISNLSASYFTMYNYLGYGSSAVYTVRASANTARNACGVAKKMENLSLSYLVDPEKLKYVTIKSNSAVAQANSGDQIIYMDLNDFTANIKSGMEIYKAPITNRLLYTEELDNPYWSRSGNANGAYLSVSKDSIKFPGTTSKSSNAELLVPAKYNQVFYIQRKQDKNSTFANNEGFEDGLTPLDSNKRITFSGYFKYKPNGTSSANANTIVMAVYNSDHITDHARASFNIATGDFKIGSNVGYGAANTNPNSVMANCSLVQGTTDWYRCWISCIPGNSSGNSQNSGSHIFRIYVTNASNKTSAWKSDGISGIYAWGLQAEQTTDAKPVPTRYKRNRSQTVARETYVGTVLETTENINTFDILLEGDIAEDEDVLVGQELLFKNISYDNPIYIPNKTTFNSILEEKKYDPEVYGVFVAKYPGLLGNSLKVTTCSDADEFDNWVDPDTNFDYSKLFDGPPGTSEYVIFRNDTDNKENGQYGYDDEIYIVVVDEQGLFTGTSGTILEKHILSKGSDILGTSGRNIYYIDYLNNYSNYILALGFVNPQTTRLTWGKKMYQVVAYASTDNSFESLSGGLDMPADIHNICDGWNLLKSKDLYNYDLVLTANYADSKIVEMASKGEVANASNKIISYIHDEVVNGRKDCIMFVTPEANLVINQVGREANNISNWVTDVVDGLKINSSYLVVDSNWKYQYDPWKKIYRWVPMNGDVAGLCARTDKNVGPWYSPAGYNRGKIMNVVKLAWNPNKQERDTLYKNGVNPIMYQTGEGTLLFGDKTHYNKNSAFNRINVRRLFITLEKTISEAAKRQMFEMNDSVTRSKFVSLIEPYLRNVQGRRGIENFKVVCDSSNNPPSVINNNGFVADIYIQPEKSINFIQLNFVAVPSGINFNTIVH